ncbi:hypothetical protein ACN47E_006518 [Coniothyrium glycines]
MLKTSADARLGLMEDAMLKTSADARLGLMDNAKLKEVAEFKVETSTDSDADATDPDDAGEEESEAAGVEALPNDEGTKLANGVDATIPGKGPRIIWSGHANSPPTCLIKQ